MEALQCFNTCLHSCRKYKCCLAAVFRRLNRHLMFMCVTLEFFFYYFFKQISLSTNFCGYCSFVHRSTNEMFMKETWQNIALEEPFSTKLIWHFICAWKIMSTNVHETRIYLICTKHLSEFMTSKNNTQICHLSWRR